MRPPAPSDKVNDEGGSVEPVQLDESRLNARCQEQRRKTAVAMTITLPKEMAEQVQTAAQERGGEPGEVVRLAVTGYLAAES